MIKTLLVRNDLENADLNSEMRVSDEQNQQTFVGNMGSDLSVSWPLYILMSRCTLYSNEKKHELYLYLSWNFGWLLIIVDKYLTYSTVSFKVCDRPVFKGRMPPPPPQRGELAMHFLKYRQMFVM